MWGQAVAGWDMHTLGSCLIQNRVLRDRFTTLPPALIVGQTIKMDGLHDDNDEHNLCSVAKD